jgi:hypothetical protein
MGEGFDQLTEGAARRLSQSFTRKSLFGRVAATALLVAGGEGGVLAFRAAPALAAYSPLCQGTCYGNCPAGTIDCAPNCCWVGCDNAICAMKCCDPRPSLICDCCCQHAVNCPSCGNSLPCIYYNSNLCTYCRRVYRCETGPVCCG